MQLLLIEDDADLAARMLARLAMAGFAVEHVVTAEAALDWASLDIFAALVVDVGLPGMNGIEFVRVARRRGLTAPILILTARGSWEEKVVGLNAGADDYVVKPARAEEIVARLRALLRRSAGQPQPRLRVGGLELDQQARIAYRDGVDIDLTYTEFRLLQLFMHRSGRILAQADILDQLYPMAEERDLNTVEVHVGRLRRKIGKDAIRTVRGLGYRLER
jgi:two-component system OmpR family response regulator